jgi:Flp pilus assembly pilin Flp
LKNFLNDSKGQTSLENTLVIALLVIVIIASVPSLQKSIAHIFDKTNQTLTGEIAGDTDSRIEKTNWQPPELSLTDNRAVYCQGNINLSEGAKINGNVLANGVINLGPGSHIEYGVVAMQANYDFNFPLPEFPKYPYGSVSAKGTLQVEDQTATTELTDNGYYEKLSVANTLVINTGGVGNVREIIVDNLDLGSSGKIVLSGEGILNLYVRDTLTFTGNAAINSGGSSGSIILYYQGDAAINFGGGNQVFIGSLYTEKSDFTILGGTSIVEGNIVVGGSIARIENTKNQLNKTLLYAPNAELILTDTVIKGKVVVNSIQGSGDSTIEYSHIQLNSAFTWSQ